ncbi:MAG: hypothetical protein ACFFAS_19235 [Promethearchaeota archaeon]
MTSNKIIFIHGLESSGQGFKGNFFRNVFPNINTPNFYGPLEQRMEKLNSILLDKDHWIIIGSSFGGLMGALFTLRNPQKVDLLILLAPLLLHPKLHDIKTSIRIPVIIFHGKRDDVVPLEPTKARAEELFINLEYNEVDDDHFLRPTTKNNPWMKILKGFLK